MNEREELIVRCNKMSFYLGILTGGLYELLNSDHKLLDYQKRHIEVLLNRVTEGLQELYYSEEVK